MLEHYLMKINSVYGLIENQSLTQEERNIKILLILSEFKSEAENREEERTKRAFKLKLQDLLSELNN
jgi:hypothetical protein